MHGPEQELERLRFAIAASGDAVYDWDVASGCITWSDNARDVLGIADLEDVAHRATYFARLHREDRAVLADLEKHHLRTQRRFECEYRVQRKDREYAWVHDRGMPEFDCHSEPVRVICTVRSIGLRKQSENRLVRLVNYDELTGQYNRARLREALQSALAYSGRYDVPGAYLLVAIDNLTLINYIHGHDVADRAIVATSRALDQCLRASDVIGRVGNDQFGVVLNGSSSTNVASIAEKILNGVQQSAWEGGQAHPPLTVSIGIVTHPDTVREAYDAMAKAEVALEQSRRAGHNCFSIYNLSEEESRDLRVHIQTAETVQTALKKNKLDLAFQPIVDAATSEPAFYECLLRLTNENGEMISAGMFLPIVEQMGLARPIDRRVLEMVVQELIEHPGVNLALNMSVLSTTDPAWLRLFTNLLKDRRDVATRLLIEITETAVLEDVKEAARFVSTMRDLGCRVALDDFGAGYTSFRHLQEMSVDVVKIDGSFVQSLVERADSRLFVRTLQSFADGLGLQTVAECIENQEAANLLVGHGVHFLQDWHFGRPSIERPWLTHPGGNVMALPLPGRAGIPVAS